MSAVALAKAGVLFRLELLASLCAAPDKTPVPAFSHTLCKLVAVAYRVILMQRAQRQPRCSPLLGDFAAPSLIGWHRWHRPTALALGLALLTLTGCSVFLRETPAPIPTKSVQMSAEGRASTLVVFLPGRRDSMADFEREGFVAALMESGANADTITVDAHFGYYVRRTVIERLQADVLQPAREQGYSRIVLVGVSLGGLGALLCERDVAGSVDALVLLAPYLGQNARFFEEIITAGGPAAWAAGRDPRAGGVEEQVWTFLGTRSKTLPPTWLLFGRSDSLAPGHRLLGEILPAGRVATIDGGHDWPTWRALWRDVCFQSDLFQAEKTSGVPTVSDLQADTQTSRTPSR